jgi:hypothetical protein
MLMVGVFLFAFQVSAQKTKITKTWMPPLKENELVLFFAAYDTVPTNAIEIGVLHSVDYEPKGKATPQQLLEILKQHARDNGANVLKIKEIKPPGLTAICERLVATMYKIDSIHQYEKLITWSKDRKLNWDDFKGEPMINSREHLAAFAECDFVFQTEIVYTTSKVHPYTPTVFLCQSSWVLPDSMRATNALAFQQLKFDLSEVYARQCRSNFAKSGFDEVRSPDLAKKAFHKIYLDYLDELEACTSETEYGRNQGKFIEWRHKIDEQLKLLQEYKSS